MFVVKVPGVNGLGKTLGCKNSGNALLAELKKLNLREVEKLDLEEIHLDNSNLELTNKLIYKNSFEAYENFSKVIFIGGDHSISYSLTRSFFDYCENSGDEPCLIVFDSHAGCKDSIENGFPTNLGWLRGLIDDGFPVKNILLVGVRNFDKEEQGFLQEHRLKMVSMNQLLEDLNDSCEIIMEFARGKNLYVSINMGVIDPAFAPLVCFPEPGGLSSREFLYLVQRMKKMKNLRAVDLVEVDSEKDESGLTIKLGAKILAELI